MFKPIRSAYDSSWENGPKLYSSHWASLSFFCLQPAARRWIIRLLSGESAARHGLPWDKFISLSPQKAFFQLQVYKVSVALFRMSLKKSTSTLPGRLTMAGALLRYCNIAAAMLCLLCGVINGKALATADTLQQEHFLSFCSLPCTLGS